MDLNDYFVLAADTRVTKGVTFVRDDGHIPLNHFMLNVPTVLEI